MDSKTLKTLRMQSQSLTQLADELAIDKGTRHRTPHGYTLLYDMLFSDRRYESLTILELGLQTPTGLDAQDVAGRTGSAISSVRMWNEFFPNAKFIGVDISDFSQFEDEDFEFIRADLSDEAGVQKILEKHQHFDLIIDDASHATHDQMVCFKHLFPALREGGIYIVEDTHWQPGRSEFAMDLNFREILAHFSLYGVFPEHAQIFTQAFDHHTMNIGGVLIQSPGHIQPQPERACVIHKAANASNSCFRMKINNEYKDDSIRLNAAKKLRSLYPDDARILFETAVAFSDSGHAEQALGVLNEIKPEDRAAETIALHAKLLATTGQVEELKDRMANFQAGVVGEVHSSYDLIEALIDANLIEPTDQFITTFLEDTTRQPIFTYRLACAFAVSSQPALGTELLERAVQKLPARQECYITLMEHYAVLNERDKLSESIDRAIARFKQDAGIIQIAASACGACGHTEKLRGLRAEYDAVLSEHSRAA